MRLRRTGVVVGAVLAASTTVSAPTQAYALDVRADAGGYAVIALPAVDGAKQLWIDVEAPSIGADDVIAALNGRKVAMGDSPYGASTVLEHDGTVGSLRLGLLRAAVPDIALTFVDSEGRVLYSDAERLSLGVVQRDPDSTPTTPPPATDAPTSGPSVTVTVRPTSAPSAPAAPGRRPGLPSAGVEASVVVGALLAAIAGACALVLQRRGSR